MRTVCTAVVAAVLVLCVSASAQWIRTSGPTGGYPYCFLTSGTTLYVGTASGVFRSTDNGQTWIPSGSGLPQASVTSIVGVSGALFAGTLGGGVYLSTDGGDSWTATNSGLTNLTVRDLMIVPGTPIATLFAGTDNGVYRASSVSLTWIESNSGLPTAAVSSLALLGGEVFVGMPGNAVYRSTNNGSDWIFDNDGSLGSTIVNALTVSGSELFAGTAAGVFRRTGEGSWVSASLTSSFVSALTTGALVLYAGTWDGFVFKSTDNGTTWDTLSAATLPQTGIGALHFHDISPYFVFAGIHARGVWLYGEQNDEWVERNAGLSNTIVNAVVHTGSALIAGSGDAGLARSTDDGDTWTTVYIDSTTTYVSALAARGTVIYAGTNAGVLRSSDDGVNWTWSLSGLSNRVINAMLASSANTNIYAGTANGVFRSSTGTSWVAASNGLVNRYVRALAEKGSLLFVGTSTGVSSSTDNGANWTGTGLSGTVVDELAVVNGNVYAGNASGVYESTDDGLTWQQRNRGLTDVEVKSLCEVNSSLVAGTWGGEVFEFETSDTTWRPLGTGLGGAPILSLGTNGTQLFAGSSLAGVWSLELITGLERTPTTPVQMRLLQNYPNPFNPTTTLSFELPVASHVRMTLFDLLGRSIAVLLDEQRESGRHRIIFDGKGMPSGIYLYRLEAGSYSETKKFVLLK